MLSFAQPILFFAAAGIIIPVLIHLWNVRRKKLRKIGSVQLLQQNAQSKSRSWQFNERLLLLLRCLLITALAALLAGPFLPARSKAKGWVLIEPAEKKTIYPAFKQTIDSLMNAGFESHALDTSFREMDLRTKEVRDSASLPYWSLLKLADEKLPAGFPVYVFTGRELQRFAGDRPLLAMEVHWQSLDHQHDTVQPYIKIDTLRVLVYADEANDRQYLTAALDAIQKKTQLPLNLVTTAQTDWLFWLSEKPVPDSIKYSSAFLYSKGKEEQGVFLFQPNKNEEPVLFAKLITNDNADVFPVWSDGKGQTILGCTATKPTHYFFYSRLRPGWNNMIWNGTFAEELFELLRPDGFLTLKDNRPIDAEQLQPVIITEKKQAAWMQQKDLRLFFWLLAFGLFAAERFVSFRKKKHER